MEATASSCLCFEGVLQNCSPDISFSFVPLRYKHWNNQIHVNKIIHKSISKSLRRRRRLRREALHVSRVNLPQVRANHFGEATLIQELRVQR